MQVFLSDRRQFSSCALVLLLCSIVGSTGTLLSQSAAAGAPRALRADALVEPLGIDDPKPMLSWQLQDGAAGARQTAYRVTVFLADPEHRNARAFWSSGRIDNDISTGVAYQGPPLAPCTRYYWRVEVWGKNGKAYPISRASWWETGLMTETGWNGQWIGYEEPELHAIRESSATWISAAAKEASMQATAQGDFRLGFLIDRPVQRAILYVTGQDTAAAWVNGAKVLEAAPLPKWNQAPWGTYTRRDITTFVHTGHNLMAVGVTRFLIPSQKSIPALSPMSMCLYLVEADGSTRVLTSSARSWKAALNAEDGWWQNTFKDTAWKEAIPYSPPGGGFGGGVGLPWPTGPVAALRHNFTENKPVLSARLYATALGAYKFRINGGPVGDQILAPGWMDYREHVAYQVYDVTSLVKRGENVIAAYLAPGWYSTPLRWFRQVTTMAPHSRPSGRSCVCSTPMEAASGSQPTPHGKRIHPPFSRRKFMTERLATRGWNKWGGTNLRSPTPPGTPQWSSSQESRISSRSTFNLFGRSVCLRPSLSSSPSRACT